MPEHVNWLQQELGRASDLRDRKLTALEDAKREYEAAQEQVNSLKSVLTLATGNPELFSDEAAPSRGRGRPTMADIAEHALRRDGPLPIEALLEELAKHGRKTSRGSLNTTLNQTRPERFERDEQGRWYLTREAGEKK